MRNELIEKSDFRDPERNKVLDVLNKSKETALQRYEHPVYDTELGLGPMGWYRLISRTPVQFTPEQFAVFRAVHKWRDDVARQEDESPLFIMPNHAVFSIARLIPSDKAALFNAVQHVSHILRVRADELVTLIAEAKGEGVNGPDLYVTLQRIADLRKEERAQPETVPVQVTPTPLAPIVRQVPLPVALDSPALRASRSSFWGKLWSGAVEQRRSLSNLSINLAVPLPPLTAEIFADTNGVAEGGTPMTEKPEHTFVPKEERPAEDERTDIFVVKQLGGRKRKRAETAEDLTESTPQLDPMQEDEIMLEETPVAAWRTEKEAKKAARKAKKERKTQEAAASEGLNYDDEPFDYANAPSVLHARDAEKKQTKKDKKEKKKDQGFNPYSKLTDAPKGLPRAQKESAGRSKTFTS